MPYDLIVRGGQVFFQVDEEAREGRPVIESAQPVLTLPKELDGLPKIVRCAQWWDSRVVLVVELKPATHTTSWIKGLEERIQTGRAFKLLTKRQEREQQYEYRTLAFPYIVLILPFYERRLQTRDCYVFYRTQPLASWDDPLLMTNLLNVRYSEYTNGWLSLKYEEEEGLSWEDAVKEVVRYFFWSGFNLHTSLRSTQFWQMRESGIDQRIVSVQEWEKASKENSEFMLDIAWPESGRTVREVVDDAFWQRMTPLHGLRSRSSGGEP